VAQAPLRFVTATSIFDGHDAAINEQRRKLSAHRRNLCSLNGFFALPAYTSHPMGGAGRAMSAW
jgi:hypothetical protein